MRCRKIIKQLPLLAGEEFPPEKAREIHAHLDDCLRCRKEYEAYRHAVKTARAWMASERRDLPEEDWHRMIQQAVQEASVHETRPIAPLVPWPFSRAWAVVLMAFIVLAGALMVIRPSLLQDIRHTAQAVLRLQEREEPGMPVLGEQDVIAMTLVSKEAGVEIKWIFNKHFDLREEK